MSGVGLFVAALQGAWPWAGICASALVGLGAWAWRTQRRRHARTAALEVRLQALVAASDLQQLDALLEQVAKESRAATVEQLVGFKESLVRCVGLTTTHEEQGLLASEDGLFVRETVRRYAPDSLQAFLKVPRAERGTQEIEAGKTALTLLEEQIGLLTQQLNVREARLGQISGEALLQQQRFLAAKTTSSHL
ncbi:MAG: hypothetical protein CFE44_07455 [Burkholderiales bacterium PBB4]|nr:MAG: hypothetical protein CFE44_07455 [Burkholderiales bacterium PBB4]